VGEKPKDHGMTQRNDPDQQALYFAERTAFHETLHDEALDSDDFLMLAHRLFSHDWWERNRVPVPEIEPTSSQDTSSYASVYADRPEKDPIIRIAPCDIRPWVLAHEAAHIAHYHFYRQDNYGVIEAHGLEFRQTYLAVAEIVLGAEASQTLVANFDLHIAKRPGGRFDHPSNRVRIPGPRSRYDLAGEGLYPAWRSGKQREALRQPHPVGLVVPRINGAIAL
jgi:hypothetical protein